MNQLLQILTVITAETLHKKWMQNRLDNGWVYGPHRDDEKKSNPCLVPFDLLPKEEQESNMSIAQVAVESIFNCNADGKLSFSAAIIAVKQGFRIARAGWNGKGMFVYYVAGGKYPAQMEAIKGVFEDDKVPYVPYLAMKTADNKVVPWLISQTDALAEDWVIVK